MFKHLNAPAARDVTVMLARDDSAVLLLARKSEA